MDTHIVDRLNTDKVLKFANDTKVFRTDKTDQDTLQDDLPKMIKWSETWRMIFNFGKFICIHIGGGNVNKNYIMGDIRSGTSVTESDQGVTVSDRMIFAEQCGIAASKGNQMSGMLKRNIT